MKRYAWIISCSKVFFNSAVVQDLRTGFDNMISHPPPALNLHTPAALNHPASQDHPVFLPSESTFYKCFLKKYNGFLDQKDLGSLEMQKLQCQDVSPSGALDIMCSASTDVRFSTILQPTLDSNLIMEIYQTLSDPDRGGMETNQLLLQRLSPFQL